MHIESDSFFKQLKNAHTVLSCVYGKTFNTIKPQLKNIVYNNNTNIKLLKAAIKNGLDAAELHNDISEQEIETIIFDKDKNIIAIRIEDNGILYNKQIPEAKEVSEYLSELSIDNKKYKHIVCEYELPPNRWIGISKKKIKKEINKFFIK